MRKVLVLVLVVFSFHSCKKESFLRISSSEVIKSYEPDFSSPRRYAATEDTLVLQLISQSSTYEEVPGINGAGSLGDFDNLELERRNLVAGIDSPYFRFNFEIVSSYFPESPSRSKDVLLVSMRQSETSVVAEMQLEYIDSLRCLSPNCSFSDTLMIDSVEFYNVYYLDNDLSEPGIYLNQDKGLLGFRISGSNTYKSLD